jgi:hypothetical protein
MFAPRRWDNHSLVRGPFSGTDRHLRPLANNYRQTLGATFIRLSANLLLHLPVVFEYV